jgi:hypothetical protein
MGVNPVFLLYGKNTSAPVATLFSLLNLDVSLLTARLYKVTMNWRLLMLHFNSANLKVCQTFELYDMSRHSQGQLEGGKRGKCSPLFFQTRNSSFGY